MKMRETHAPFSIPIRDPSKREGIALKREGIAFTPGIAVSRQKRD